MSARKYAVFPVGKPGVPWGDAERAQWLSMQSKKRDYFNDVVSPLMRLANPALTVSQYGEMDYRPFGAAKFPLFCVKTTPWNASLPLVAITGGVHGYETSGVHGALQFIHTHMASYVGRVNIVVLPCVSPWGYEVIHRWTPNAVDPNRSFKPGTDCLESGNAMACIEACVQESSRILLHMDLHETTDSDNTEFIPARFARDGKESDPYEPIPDGFYVFGDNSRPKKQDDFLKALIAAVQKVTHIAEPDEKNEIVGEPVTYPGVLLSGPADGTADFHTKADYVTTTEVYPDSERTNPQQCNDAHVAAVLAGIDYVLEQK